MKKINILFVVAAFFLFHHSKAQQLITKESPYAFAQTTERLKKNIESSGLTIISHIDHAGAAAKHGLDLSPLQVFIFGNPKVGSLLMQEDPRAGLDLPLKILVWEKEGKTFIAYRDPSFLLNEYQITKQKEIITRMQNMLKKITDEAVQK